jgi:hypothetical protein
MHVFLTVRRLKPGTFDDWREAWQPEKWPEEFEKAYILRKLGDENEVIAFGFFAGDVEAARADPAVQQEMQRRADAMAPYIDSVGADGVYEVVDEVTPPS